MGWEGKRAPSVRGWKRVLPRRLAGRDDSTPVSFGRTGSWTPIRCAWPVSGDPAGDRVSALLSARESLACFEERLEVAEDEAPASTGFLDLSSHLRRGLRRPIELVRHGQR